jgi:uncharacterized membrane protein YfcA
MLIDLLLFAVGVVIGVINAVAGGGMLLGFPIFIATGLPAIVADASTRLVALPASIGAGAGYRKSLKKLPKYYWWMLGFAVAGAAVGGLLLRDNPSKQFAHIAPWLVLAAVAIFALGPTLQKRLNEKMHRKVVLAGYALAAILFFLSIYAGYFGIGFGFMVLALLNFSSLRDDIHLMNAFKVICGLAASLVSTIVLLHSNLLNWQAGLSMGAGSLIGGYFTAHSSRSVPQKYIRGFVVTFGLASVIYLLFFR